MTILNTIRPKAMSELRDIYIVRQNAFVFVAFIFAGCLFCVFPWFIESTNRLLMHLVMTGFGLLALFVGIVGWKSVRIGLVVDRRGVWLAGYSLFRKRLVPWDAITNAKSLKWTSPEGEHHDVVLGLKNVESHPAREHRAHYGNSPFINEEEDPDYKIPLIIGHDEWDWNPDELVKIVLRCVRSPSEREEFQCFDEGE